MDRISLSVWSRCFDVYVMPMNHGPFGSIPVTAYRWRETKDFKLTFRQPYRLGIWFDAPGRNTTGL